MLSKEDNELVTRVGPGTPMGDLMREYWVPAMAAEELPRPDGDPVRVKLLGEPLIAFRDSTGQVVFIDSHHTVKRYVGPALDSLVHKCTTVMGSGKNADPAMYDNREWLATMFTRDGVTVHGIIHD